MISRAALGVALACALALSSALVASARSRPSPDASPSGFDPFVALDVYIDSGAAPLGAYQVEITPAPNARVQLVGVEGGDGAGFAAPPAYDPAALHADANGGGFERVILAAFSLDNAHAPTGKIRVARVHFHADSYAAPAFSIRLIRAGDPDANPIRATASLAPVDTRGPNR